MRKLEPRWRKYIPEFLGELQSAGNEIYIQKACAAILQIVEECYVTASSRRNPMSVIRKSVQYKFPAKEVTENDTNAEFPYYFTSRGQGRKPRWEHLAIKYLEEPWNRKEDRTFETAKLENEIVSSASVKQQNEIMKNHTETVLELFGLTDSELEVVRQAIGDAGIEEWVKQAILQRANAINALHERLAEDLSMVPSEKLMSDKRYRTNANACRELTSRAVRAIKVFNSQSPEHKWCLTNALISEITGSTPKAIAKAVEGMDLDSYNKSMGLTPVNNRLTKAELGEIKSAVSIADVLGIEE